MGSMSRSCCIGGIDGIQGGLLVLLPELLSDLLKLIALVLVPLKLVFDVFSRFELHLAARRVVLTSIYW